jgi:uncharacterized glyoxalase superfamily protein PhnB
MKPPPKGWSRLAVSVFYDDPKAAIDWLCRAFGFELRLKVEGDGGDIVHSELLFGDAVIMVGGTRGGEPYQKRFKSPKQLGGALTQTLALFVDDCDQQYARAVAAGAETIREPRVDDYGDDYWVDRTCGVTDPEGHLWWFMQRIKG